VVFDGQGEHEAGATTLWSVKAICNEPVNALTPPSSLGGDLHRLRLVVERELVHRLD
jgi:hypothetical protein